MYAFVIFLERGVKIAIFWPKIRFSLIKHKLFTKHILPINITAYVTSPDTLVSTKLDLCDIDMVKIIQGYYCFTPKVEYVCGV